MTFAGDIRPLDLGDPSALAQAYAVECEASRQSRPGWVPLGESERLAAWRASQGWAHRLVGAFEDGGLVGFAGCATAHDTLDTSWVSVAVLPRHQRRQVGTRLVQAAEDRCPRSAARFVASASRPRAADIERLATGFAQPLGYVRASAETVVQLDLVGADLPVRRPPTGYTVSTHLGGVPDHLRDQVGELKGLVDAQAPHGELDWQPTPVSRQAYDDEIALWRAQGRTAIESIAVTAHGVVAAWTCLVVASDTARPAQVEGTMVLAEDRGRGLGRAVKVASLVAAREHGGSARVRTSSDDENVWMRAINDELGFVPVESEIILQKPRGSPSS